MFDFLKKKKKKVYDKWFLLIFATIVVCIGIGNELYKGTNAISVSVDEQRKALLETAHAYYRQGVQHQYDSYRKNLYSTPEDATSQHYTYTVCSGFTYQVYYQTFGIEIPDTTEELLDYAEKNKDNKELVPIFYKGVDNIYSEDVLGTAEVSNYLNLSREWVDLLLPGDVIIVTGHAFMVDSIDYDEDIVYIIESAGSRYNIEKHFDNYDEKGTIQYRSLSHKMGVYYNRVGNGDEIERLAVIRFIREDSSYTNIEDNTENYKILDSAKSRVKYPDIDIEKTVKISDGNEVSKQNVMVKLGGTITYEITIKNNSGYEGNSLIENKKQAVDYGSFDVVENIDPRLEIIEVGNGTISNNQIKWSFSKLSAGKSVKISYVVKIPNDSSLLNEVIISTGLVDNIATSRIESLVGNSLSNEEKNKLLASYNKLENNSKFERDFINDLYLDAFGLELGLNNELTNFDIMSYNSSVMTGGNDVLSVKSTKINDTSISKYIYNNFYGLRMEGKNLPNKNIVHASLQWNFFTTNEFNDRARTLTADMLDDGDIVLVYLGDTSTDDEDLVNKAYIYLDGSLKRKKSQNEFEVLDDVILEKFLRNIIGDNYVILRPSIKMLEQEKELFFNNNIIVDEDNKYVKFKKKTTSVKEFLTNIDVVDGARIFVSDKDSNEKSENDLVVTGDILTVFVGSEKVDEYNIAIRGDANGDGKVSSSDLVQIRKHIVGWLNPKTGIVEKKTGIYLYAIDMNEDNKVTSSDLVRMRKIIVGIDIDE